MVLVGSAFADGRGQRPRLRASMYFAYGRRKRPEVSARTTFEAVLRLERTSTTRFPGWPGYERWKAVRPGDLVEFFEDKEMSGRSLVVRVTEVGAIDLVRCDEETAEQWSRAEGWTVEEGRVIGMHNGPGIWIRYELISPAPEAAPAALPVEEAPQLSFGF